MTAASHSAGGKSKRSLHPGIEGFAEISPCGQYRPWLARLRISSPIPGVSAASPSGVNTLDQLEPLVSGLTGHVILFVGLNPSVADPSIDDPTVYKEQKMAFSWGFHHYLKANILDYRSTNPQNLPASLSDARSPANLPAIRRLSRMAENVVMASGIPPTQLSAAYHETVCALRSEGVVPQCLGLTKYGWPRHPLYVALTTIRQRLP